MSLEARGRGWLPLETRPDSPGAEMPDLPSKPQELGTQHVNLVGAWGETHTSVCDNMLAHQMLPGIL